MKLTANLDKLGVIGVFITALVTPCCFPLFGFLLSAFGFGSAELFGGWTKYVFQGLIFFSLLGTFISFRKHKNIYPLLIGFVSAGLIVYAYNFNFESKIIYVGMFGLLVSTGLNYYLNRRLKIICATCTIIDGKRVELESIITCPNCEYKKKEIMPTDACQFFYECKKCKTVLKPKQGDCCVYCSYGTVKCPSKQIDIDCC